MNVSIAGTGYVGLSTGVGFAVKGNDVTCVDIVKEKVERINSGNPPIYEPGLEDYLKTVLQEKRFRATTDIKEAVRNSDITFISVGTPSREDGSIDLSFIEQVARDISSAIREKGGYHVVVVKSTVVPGTTEGVVLPNLEKAAENKLGEFGLCMNPEFLREGKAMEDFLNPDRIVIGSADEKAGNLVKNLFTNFSAPVLMTDIKTAEMIKYASNALLATKISFTNEIGNICKRLGIDVYDVMKGVGMDSRISPKFLEAGAGYGGSCFPKDVEALISKAKSLDYIPHLLNETHKLNLRQKVRLVEMLERKAPIDGKTVCILGLAFKPDSDDIREAPAINIIDRLKQKGCLIRAYDPKAMENMKKIHPDITYARDAKEALEGADACLILTDWEEFKNLEDSDFSAMKEKVIIEGRKVLDRGKVSGFEGICW